MELWIIGIILFAGTCFSSSDASEVKRFHIPSRQLRGIPQCVEIRQKRSTREADYGEKIEIPSSPASDDENVPELARQLSNIKPNIADEDVSGSAEGILIVKNPKTPGGFLVFAVRPVSGNSNRKKYLQMKIINNNSKYEDDDEEDYEYPIDNNDQFYDYGADYSENHEGDSVISKAKNQKKKNSMLRDLEEDTISKKPTGNRPGNRNKISVKPDVRVLKIHSTDSSPVDCIVIEKDSELSSNENEKSPNGRTANKGYGLRKRYKGKRV